MTRTELEMRTGRFWSDALRSEQDYAYFLPAKAESDPQRRYPLYVLLHGHGGSYLDWARHTRLARHAAGLSLCIALFDGDNGWYTNAADGGARYEDALMNDFVPHVQSSLPVLPAGRNWGIGGASMGGYGAVKTALQYPDRFLLGVSHSGAFDEPWQPAVHPVFGDPERDRVSRRAANVYSLAED